MHYFVLVCVYIYTVYISEEAYLRHIVCKAALGNLGSLEIRNNIYFTFIKNDAKMLLIHALRLIISSNLSN